MRLNVTPCTSYYEKSNIISSCFTCIIKMCPSKHPKNMQYECVYKTIHFIACCHILFRDTISNLYHNDRCILHLLLAAKPKTCEE